jgi:hypothetical protein
MRHALHLLCFGLAIAGVVTLAFGGLMTMSPPLISPETSQKFKFLGTIFLAFGIPALLLAKVRRSH